MQMPEQHFELTTQGKLTDARLDALFEAGCDDATFSTKGALTFAAFDREAPSLLDAILSAIAATESVDGLEVLHVDPDELVWASEIAQRTGRTRQSIDQLIKGQRGPGDFPPPATHATRNPLWRWSEVETWFATSEGRTPDTERSLVLGAVNGTLQARHSYRGAGKPAPLRRALQKLLAS
jgi:predicted DNA-binding transcriptional regulator AlpA